MASRRASTIAPTDATLTAERRSSVFVRPSSAATRASSRPTTDRSGPSGPSRSAAGQVDRRGRVGRAWPGQRGREVRLAGSLADHDDVIGAGADAEIGDDRVDDLVGRGRAGQALEDPREVLGLGASVGRQLGDRTLMDDGRDAGDGDRAEDDQAEWPAHHEDGQPGQAEQGERAGEEPPGGAEPGVGGPAREGFERCAEGAGHVLQRMKCERPVRLAGRGEYLRRSSHGTNVRGRARTRVDSVRGIGGPPVSRGSGRLAATRRPRPSGRPRRSAELARVRRSGRPRWRRRRPAGAPAASLTRYIATSAVAMSSRAVRPSAGKPAAPIEAPTGIAPCSSLW